MKKAIKIIAIICVTILMLSGCTGSNKDDGIITVGFSQIGAESAWRVANTESIQSEAAKDPISN
jgi:hypothetical protein